MDRMAIACNFSASTKTVTKGTKAYVLPWTTGGAVDGGRVQVRYRSRGGRKINKWEPLKRLTNYRICTIPPEHPFYEDASEGDLKGDLSHIQYHAGVISLDELKSTYEVR